VLSTPVTIVRTPIMRFTFVSVERLRGRKVAETWKIRDAISEKSEKMQLDCYPFDHYSR
jgi:hypothetical protein